MNIEKIGRIIFVLMFLGSSMWLFAGNCQAQTAKKKKYSNTHHKKTTRKASNVKSVPPKIAPVRIMPKTEQFQTVAAGSWGATGINLSIGAGSSQIQFDCADAEITDVLQIDSQGNFTANGYFVRGTHGPIRIDAAPKQNPATFTGMIAGDSMNLKITLVESGEVIGEYSLGKDAIGRIRRCY